MPKINLITGDITKQDVDAIVNAANSSLMGGGGVDGAIHRAGGPSIVEECRQIRAERYGTGLPTGEAVATGAGKLPSRWVIHTVGPVYAKSEDRSHLLASCHRRSLEVAEDIGAETVAFPAISTGIYRYPVDQAAAIALRTVAETESKVTAVTFVLFDERTHRAFDTALSELKL
jgi:O-acetyl-ADP-ribose deacetylase (regulator of RNase III)